MKKLLLLGVMMGGIFAFICSGGAQTNVLSLDSDSRTILREAMEDKWFKKDNFFSTLVGGFLALAGGVTATWYAHMLQARQKDKEDSQFTTNVLRAIRGELEALARVYERGIGGYVAELADNQVFEVRLGLTQDWFTVFSANAVHIGRLDGDISQRLITIYALVKAIIEELKINNECLAERNHLDLMKAEGNSHRDLPQKIQQVHQRLLAKAREIKLLHQTLRTATSELFILLDQRGVK